MHWSEKMINVSINLQQLVRLKKCAVGMKHFLIINVKNKERHAYVIRNGAILHPTNGKAQKKKIFHTNTAVLLEKYIPLTILNFQPSFKRDEHTVVIYS